MKNDTFDLMKKYYNRHSISWSSNIIKGKIQHDKTFSVAAATATANQYNLRNIAKFKQDYRVDKKRGGEGEREREGEGGRGRERERADNKIPSKLPGRDQ